MPSGCHSLKYIRKGVKFGRTIPTCATITYWKPLNWDNHSLKGLSAFSQIRIWTFDEKLLTGFILKDLSSSFQLWNRKNLKKKQGTMKIFLHFSRNIIATSTIFIYAYIFSDRRLKNHKIFTFHFCRHFWKYFENFRRKSGRITY